MRGLHVDYNNVVTRWLCTGALCVCGGVYFIRSDIGRRERRLWKQKSLVKKQTRLEKVVFSRVKAVAEFSQPRVCPPGGRGEGRWGGRL